MQSELIGRWAGAQVLAGMADTRVVLVMGARQVGKSTLVGQLAEQNSWGPVLTFDDKAIRDAASADPTGFVAGLPPHAVLDEIQRVPDVLLAIKEAVDRNPQPGRFLLTGSANVMTNRRAKDALTGRIDIVTLWPLAQGETEKSTEIVDALVTGNIPMVEDAPIGIRSYAPIIAGGGYPEARGRTGSRRGRWFENYIDTTLDRDLRDVSDALRLDEIPRLLRLLASQSAGLLNYSNLADRLQLSAKTVKSYVELLETVFLVHRLPAWRSGLSAREGHAAKGHIVDSGLLLHLLGVDESRIGTDEQVTGKAVESFVAMELKKQASVSQTWIKCFHYRVGRDEVDMILETRSGDIVGIEVKASATPTPADRRALAKLRDTAGDRFKAGVVVYTGRQTIPLGDRLWAMPLAGLWAPIR